MFNVRMDRTRRIDHQAPRFILLRRSDASSSQNKMIVLASNSFEVKMSLCGDPESDVSLFFKWCVQHKRLARVSIKNAT
jgi:hypothetical protein